MTATNAEFHKTRQEFLRDLGLSRDLFKVQSAEQDFPGPQTSEKHGDLFSYVIDPTDPTSLQSLSLILKEAQNGFVFGPRGSGKTTLRYLLEAQYRTAAARQLVFTYDLRHNADTVFDVRQHSIRLSGELALDLFIQVIERLDEMLSPPTESQIQALQMQVSRLGGSVRRAISRLQQEDFAAAEYGLARIWPSLGRLPVKYVDSSARVHRLLKNLPARTVPGPNSKTGESLLEAGLAVAKTWQFEQVFVLVDNVDAADRTPAQMLALLSPLLERLAAWQTKGLFFYFFLPAQLASVLQAEYRELFNKRLTFAPAWWIINWNKDTLTELLHERLRAGGSRAAGFNALAAPEFQGKLEDYLLQAADNHPRQLLRLVSALINAHLTTTPDRSVFTPADWQTMQKQWSYGQLPSLAWLSPTKT